MMHADFDGRLEAVAARWGVDVDRLASTSTSRLAFGTRDGLPVVLKVVALDGDEARGGFVASALAGPGMVRTYEQEMGAALFERVVPGTALAEVTRAGRDDEATRVLAGVVTALHGPERPTPGFAGAEDWGRSFDRFLAGDDPRLPRALVEEAADRYARLCSTQRVRRLLHGDLQHHNILFDGDRGWVAIDPKGVVAELELELGAAFRNPEGAAALYSTTASVERRIAAFVAALDVDAARVAEWAYALGVLSAVWSLEDEGSAQRDHAGLRLADAVRPLLD